MKHQVGYLQILSRIRGFIFHHLFQRPRILKYRLLSTALNVEGKGKIYQPVLFAGPGKIAIGYEVRFGYQFSTQFYNGYIYIEARYPESLIAIGDRCWINNCSAIISGGGKIRIGSQCLLGTNVEIYDSDFHDVDPQKRHSGKPKVASVIIGDNVFIGSNVRILKGISVGDNAVIANNAVVTDSIPPNVVAAGNPARVIRPIPDSP